MPASKKLSSSKELNPTNNHMSELGSAPSLVEFLGDTTASADTLTAA